MSPFARGRLGCRAATLVAVLFALTAATPAARAADAALAVPNGTPAELLKFIAEVKKTRPTENDLAGVTAHLVRVETAVVEAAEKIVAAGPSDEERETAVGEKLAALVMLRRLETPGARDRLKTYLDELARDPHPTIPPLGKIYSLATRLQEVDRGNHAEVEAFLDDVRKHVRTARPDAKNLSLAYQTTVLVEQAELTKLAAEAYREFAEAFAKSDDPAVVGNAKKLAGSARWLTLPGNVPEIAGKKLDGDELDWKSLDGKTVLVVYWATWCGPCVAELPLLRDAYEKYHDRGFEIVAVSLDDDRRRLEDFVKREQLPWPVVFGDDPQATGWNVPAAAHYGVMSIPRSMLVGKAGRVVSIDAHGDVLWDLLAAEIGPAVEKDPPQTEAAPDVKPKEPARPAP